VSQTKTRYARQVATSVRALIKNAVFDRVPGLLRRGPSSYRRVALTFDDGPDAMTPRYLELLDDLGVPATFFVIGELATARPDLVREYLRRGHQVGGHGYDHTRFPKLSRRALVDQCRRTDEAIGGQPSGRSWVRPPHGALDARSVIGLRASGYVVALWSIDSCDYSERDPAGLAARCAPSVVSGGDVLLFHEGQEWTLEALPRIVAALHASGLECVTMHDLFAR
jgi:peptidoglycan/xylan/chitin deacetylase (PgdA/CDA1 family)